jgi:hypothetical protein
MRLVNGYVCSNCTDEELAKRGVDPAHPKDGPVTPQTSANGKAEAAGKSQAQGANGSKVEDPNAAPLGVNQPNRTGAVGTQLNVLA